MIALGEGEYNVEYRDGEPLMTNSAFIHIYSVSSGKQGDNTPHHNQKIESPPVQSMAFISA